MTGSLEHVFHGRCDLRHTACEVGSLVQKENTCHIARSKALGRCSLSGLGYYYSPKYELLGSNATIPKRYPPSSKKGNPSAPEKTQFEVCYTTHATPPHPLRRDANRRLRFTHPASVNLSL
jgi:hypothetical protein